MSDPSLALRTLLTLRTDEEKAAAEVLAQALEELACRRHAEQAARAGAEGAARDWERARRAAVERPASVQALRDGLAWAARLGELRAERDGAHNAAQARTAEQGRAVDEARERLAERKGQREAVEKRLAALARERAQRLEAAAEEEAMDRAAARRVRGD